MQLHSTTSSTLKKAALFERSRDFPSEVGRLGSHTADLAPELEGPLSDCCMPAAFRWTQCSLLLLLGHVAAPFGLRPSSEYGADPAVVAASIRASGRQQRP